MLSFKVGLLGVKNKEAVVYMSIHFFPVCISVGVYRCVCRIGKHGDMEVNPSLKIPVVVYCDMLGIEFALS